MKISKILLLTAVLGFSSCGMFGQHKACCKGKDSKQCKLKKKQCKLKKKQCKLKKKNK